MPCQPTQLAALRRALLKGKRVPAIVCVDRPPPALALRCIQLHLSLPISLLVLAPEPPPVGGASAKAVCCHVETSRPDASANLPSSPPRQHQIKLRAASSLCLLAEPPFVTWNPPICRDARLMPCSPRALPGVLRGRRAFELRAAAE